MRIDSRNGDSVIKDRRCTIQIKQRRHTSTALSLIAVQKVLP